MFSQIGYNLWEKGAEQGARSGAAHPPPYCGPERGKHVSGHALSEKMENLSSVE